MGGGKAVDANRRPVRSRPGGPMILRGTVAPGTTAIRYKPTGEAVVTFALARDGGGSVEVQVKSARPKGLVRDLADGREVMVIPARRRYACRRHGRDWVPTAIVEAGAVALAKRRSRTALWVVGA
jgi:hypothetical protein